MSKARWQFAAISIGLIFGLTLAGTIDPRQNDEAHVRYGKDFHCVAKIRCTTQKDKASRFASCVVLAPRWIVTAAHVIEGTEQWTVVREDGTEVSIKSFSVHETDDIALGKTEKDIALDFYPSLYSKNDEAGKVVSIAGYGNTGTFLSGSTVQADGRRRAGSNVIDRCDEKHVYCSVNGHGRSELEFLIAPGDSGGGLFIGNELAGVNSYISAHGRKPMSQTGDESAHARVSYHKTWIEKEMQCDE